MQALILAAGRGSRMGDKTSEVPKCLLEVGGRALIEHQLETLADCGVGPVGIVVGYCADQVREVVGIRAEYIENPRWRHTNSLYSFWLAREWVQGAVLVLNSDILLDPRIIERLLSSRGDALAFDSSGGSGAEQMKVRVVDGRLVTMSKTLPEPDIAGENVGVLRLEPTSVRRLFERAEELIRNGGENEWLGRGVAELAGEVSIRAADVAGLPWGEIDFAYDLDRVRKEVWPAIRSNGRRRARERLGKPLLAIASAVAFAFLINTTSSSTQTVYWEPLELGEPQVVLTAPDGREHTWWRLDLGGAARFGASGPAKLHIDSRLLLDGTEPPGRYALQIELDGEPLKWEDHLVRPSSGWGSALGGVAKRRTVELEVPDGPHDLQIRLVSPKPASCVLRVLQQVLEGEED